MWCSQFSVHHCSCVRTQSSPTSFQVTTAIPRTFHYFLKTYSACQDFTLPDKFSHCLKTIEILCPTAIGYKAAGQWGLSSCFIVTVFMRIFFFLVSILLIEKCFLHCPEMIVRFSVDLPNCFPGKKKVRIIFTKLRGRQPLFIHS